MSDSTNIYQPYKQKFQFMPGTLQPLSVLESERACRRRRMSAFDELRVVIESLPEEILKQWLTWLNPPYNVNRRGLTEAQIYRIAAIIIK
jgi:hypothetical protein